MASRSQEQLAQTNERIRALELKLDLIRVDEARDEDDAEEAGLARGPLSPTAVVGGEQKDPHVAEPSTPLPAEEAEEARGPPSPTAVVGGEQKDPHVAEPSTPLPKAPASLTDRGGRTPPPVEEDEAAQVQRLLQTTPAQQRYGEEQDWQGEENPAFGSLPTEHKSDKYQAELEELLTVMANEGTPESRKLPGYLRGCSSSLVCCPREKNVFVDLTDWGMGSLNRVAVCCAGVRHGHHKARSDDFR